MANGHGGQRQPARPAAVSNPQSGNRTDGGAGSKSQPLRVASGGGYGDRKAAIEQQQGAPLPVNDGSQGVARSGGGGGSSTAGGAFGPTQRPNEPITAGQMGADPTQYVPSAQDVLMELYKRYPSPWIAQLIKNG